MDKEKLREELMEALYDVAPDLVSKPLDDLANLQETYGLDSADFLNFLIRIADRTGIEVPVSDISQCATFKGTLSYVTEKIASN